MNKNYYEFWTSHVLRDHITKAIHLIGMNNVSMEDKDLFDYLVTNEIPQNDASQIVTFLPIAFVRCLLPDVNWTDTFKELNSHEEFIERNYSTTIPYTDILNVTIEYFNTLPDSQVIIKVAGRSAEFRAANQLLLDNPNETLKDLCFTDTIILSSKGW